MRIERKFRSNRISGDFVPDRNANSNPRNNLKNDLYQSERICVTVGSFDQRTDVRQRFVYRRGIDDMYRIAELGGTFGRRKCYGGKQQQRGDGTRSSDCSLGCVNCIVHCESGLGDYLAGGDSRGKRGFNVKKLCDSTKRSSTLFESERQFVGVWQCCSGHCCDEISDRNLNRCGGSDHQFGFCYWNWVLSYGWKLSRYSQPRTSCRVDGSV